MSLKKREKEISEKYESDFSHILNIINEAKTKIWQQVNSSLISLYWNVGKYVSQKIKTDSWGQSIVEELSHYILSKNSTQKGFSARNIWRMKQFYETYQGHKDMSALLTEITWTNHLHILSKTESLEEKEFYLRLVSKHRYSERELARIIDSATF